MDLKIYRKTKKLAVKFYYDDQSLVPSSLPVTHSDPITKRTPRRFLMSKHAHESIIDLESLLKDRWFMMISGVYTEKRFDDGLFMTRFAFVGHEVNVRGYAGAEETKAFESFTHGFLWESDWLSAKTSMWARFRNPKAI